MRDRRAVLQTTRVAAASLRGVPRTAANGAHRSRSEDEDERRRRTVNDDLIRAVVDLHQSLVGEYTWCHAGVRIRSARPAR